MFEHILIPLDGSPLAECVLPHTVAVALAFESRVTLMQVLEQPQTAGRGWFIDPLDWRISEAEAAAYLDSVAVRLRGSGLDVERILVEGQAGERIIEYARNHKVDLIILSSHGRSGISEWNISSVVQKVIQRAYKSAMIVRAYQPAASEASKVQYRHVLVPLDCSQRAECVLPPVTALAHFHQSQLLLTHVVSKPVVPRRAPLTPAEIKLVDRLTERNQSEATKYLKELASRLSSVPDVQTRLLIGDNAAATLHEFGARENVDLVVLSSHGYAATTKWPHGGLVLNFITYGTTPLLIVQDLPQNAIETSQAEMAAREHKGH